MTGSMWLVTGTFRLPFPLHCHFERSKKSVSSAEKVERDGGQWETCHILHVRDGGGLNSKKRGKKEL